jgi:phosphoribosylanthranilate isomerase
MFQIKVCGITSVDDARISAAAGADAIGLNFFEGSSRYVALSRAGDIAASVPPAVVRVGVFVNAPLSQIQEACTVCQLAYVQLHGDEGPELIAQLAPYPVVRAFRLTDASTFVHIEQYLSACRELGHLPHALLIDASVPGHYGGTGRRADWDAVSRRPASAAAIPLVLAGGLDPDSVGEAIARVRPAAVDVASGVEQHAGHKDASLVRRFVEQARQAFSR